MKVKREAETQLDRIENGIRALLHRVYFPTRNAWDGVKGEELDKCLAREQKDMDEFVESCLSGRKHFYF